MPAFRFKQLIGIYLLKGGGVNTLADWLDSIEARNKAQAKYDKAHTAGFYMKLNTRTDSDIIHWLWGQPSKQGAIKKLIRDEIARKSAGL